MQFTRSSTRRREDPKPQGEEDLESVGRLGGTGYQPAGTGQWPVPPNSELSDMLLASAGTRRKPGYRALRVARCGSQTTSRLFGVRRSKGILPKLRVGVVVRGASHARRAEACDGERTRLACRRRRPGDGPVSTSRSAARRGGRLRHRRDWAGRPIPQAGGLRSPTRGIVAAQIQAVSHSQTE